MCDSYTQQNVLFLGRDSGVAIVAIAFVAIGLIHSCSLIFACSLLFRLLLLEAFLGQVSAPAAVAVHFVLFHFFNLHFFFSFLFDLQDLLLVVLLAVAAILLAGVRRVLVDMLEELGER